MASNQSLPTPRVAEALAEAQPLRPPKLLKKAKVELFNYICRILKKPNMKKIFIALFALTIFACGEDKEGKGSSDESVVRELCGEDKDGKSSGDESVVSRLCGEDKDHEPSDDES